MYLMGFYFILNKIENYSLRNIYMKKLILFIAIQIITTIFSVVVFAQSGSLDPTFGTNGTELFDFTGFHENGYDIVCMEDTTMFIVGTTNVSAFFVTDGYIMKLLPDGSQDMSWGSNGLVIVDYGEDTYFYNIEILPDGKLLVSHCVNSFKLEDLFLDANKYRPVFLRIRVDAILKD